MPHENVWALLGMLLVMVVILVLAWWTTRLVASRGIPGFSENGKGQPLQILGQMNLGRSERLVLVQLGKRCVLLGVTTNSINFLLELSEEETQQWLEASQERRPTGMPSFLDVLQKNLRGKK